MVFLYIVLLSAAPFLELRGAIPFGIAAGLDYFTVFLVATTANIIIIPVIYMLFNTFFKELYKFPYIGKNSSQGSQKIKEVSRQIRLSRPGNFCVNSYSWQRGIHWFHCRQLSGNGQTQGNARNSCRSFCRWNSRNTHFNRIYRIIAVPTLVQ